ncbi:hypothetical protein SUGI_1515490 [Cryptomeria japonica]|uniref:malate dehydrogenase n=1 Tax=Cryptomeria japonica TaxID=3369 RepID=A0AAD3NTH3_CRYJA|nr:uncharacterized protein LOC131873358 [Cryptomeria japonica]GLJ59599.1 hypothetical protein SUGI_1515490 [Cryptomeria japonica]
MDSSKNQQNNNNNKSSKVTSTTSLGKRRSLNKRARNRAKGHQRREDPANSTMSSPKASEYGSQASPLRQPATPNEITKVTILGAAGGIGQPLALLLMLHSEYVQHLALYDLVHVRGIAADLSHVDRQCKVTAHLGPDELTEAVRDAKVIVIPAGLAQKPGMSRDDLFGSNAKIMYNLAKVCAQVNPSAHLAIISNPVNSLVPLTCEVYQRILGAGSRKEKSADSNSALSQPAAPPASPGAAAPAGSSAQKSAGKQQQQQQCFHDCCRRIFGVTTLDVVRASTLSAKSAFFKPEPNGLFKDPAKIAIPVVGGHAGKTIIPLLSQSTMKVDKKRLIEEKATTLTLIESIQQAGIEVLNAKKGAGSATLAMAYSACRFTISLLRAQQGEPNIIECAYVRHQQPLVSDLEYFAAPLVLSKDGYVKTQGFSLNKLLPYEQQMIEEGAKELRMSVAKGEDFAKEQLSSEKL